MMCAIFKHSSKDKKSDFSEKIFQKNRIQPITRYLISSGKSQKPIFAMYFCQTLESRNKCLLLGKALKVRLVAVWRLYKLLPVLPTVVLVLKKKRMAIRSNACRKCCQGYMSAAEATQDNILSTHK